MTFRESVKVLKARLPCAYPVRVERRPLKNYHGWSILRRRGGRWEFLVVVDKGDCETCAIDTLCHEYAHCHSRTHSHDQTDDQLKHHDAAWGVSYAACYRVVHLGGES